MYCYCENDPVNKYDPSGCLYEWVYILMFVLAIVDTIDKYQKQKEKEKVDPRNQGATPYEHMNPIFPKRRRNSPNKAPSNWNPSIDIPEEIVEGFGEASVEFANGIISNNVNFPPINDNSFGFYNKYANPTNNSLTNDLYLYASRGGKFAYQQEELIDMLLGNRIW